MLNSRLYDNKTMLTLPFLTMEASEAKGFLSSKRRRVHYKNLAKALSASHPTQAPQHVPKS